jgi:uncharacterized glyoxalase superfamily protein PhnB
MKLDMLGIVTKNIGSSLEFYRALGLDTPTSWEGPYVEMTLEGGLRLSWNDLEMVKEHDPNWEPPAGLRLGMAFLCDSVADVDARFERLARAGYAGYTPPFDAFWGQRYATVTDPDGNNVDLFFPLEATS